MRQDPDIIMVGERSVILKLRKSRSRRRRRGMVLSTLHTNDAPYQP
ncbi:MAG: hypothetical protein IPI21_11765 [Propionivibrio sp.]|nr:hypothetical protein [Propionivibrio sp.]